MQGRWTEEQPHDLEPLSVAGGSLRGRLGDGRDVAAKVVPIGSDEEADRLVARLRRMAQLEDPRLVPVLGAVREQGVVWVLSELDPGTPLETLLERGPLPPALAAAVMIEALAGVSALREAGLTHGALHPGNVHVGPGGRVRLGDYALPALTGVRPARDDVAAAGALLCAALGVPEEAADGEPAGAERSAPALVAAARALAAGGDRSPGAALALVRSASGVPAGSARHREHLAALGRLAGGEEAEPEPAVEPVASAAAVEPVVTAAVPEPAREGPARRRVPRSAWVAALVLVALLLGGTGVALGVATARQTAHQRTATAGRPAPSATAVATPTPAVSPSPADAPTPAAEIPPATPAPPATPTPTPATALADSPDGAVSRFYQLVQAHQFDDAVAMWSDRMRADYPPGENVYQRFSDTSSMTLLSDRVSSPGDQRATVSIDLVEVRGGRTYRWTGNWYLVRGGSGWLLDQPSLRPV